MVFSSNIFAEIFPRSFSTWLVRVLLLAHVRRYVADATADITLIALVRLATGISVLHKRRVLDTDGIRRVIGHRRILILPLLGYAMLFRIIR